MQPDRVFFGDKSCILPPVQIKRGAMLHIWEEEEEEEVVEEVEEVVEEVVEEGPVS